MSEHFTLTKAGAEAQAAQIRAYWLRRGYLVNAWAEATQGSDQKGFLWAVRSDMVRGFPTRRAPVIGCVA